MAASPTRRKVLTWIKQCSKSRRIIADERRGLLSRGRLSQAGCRSESPVEVFCGEGIYPRRVAKQPYPFGKHEMGECCALGRG